MLLLCSSHIIRINGAPAGAAGLALEASRAFTVEGFVKVVLEWTDEVALRLTYQF